jgi:hypothetical protein
MYDVAARGQVYLVAMLEADFAILNRQIQRRDDRHIAETLGDLLQNNASHNEFPLLYRAEGQAPHKLLLAEPADDQNGCNLINLPCVNKNIYARKLSIIWQLSHGYYRCGALCDSGPCWPRHAQTYEKLPQNCVEREFAIQSKTTSIL